MLHRGRLADNGRMGELLGITPYDDDDATSSTGCTRWPTVVRIPARRGGGVMDRRHGYEAPGHHAPGRADDDGGPRDGGRRRPARSPPSASCVDDWGRDPALVDAVVRLGRLRWNTVIGGVEHLPARGRCARSSSTPAASRWRRSHAALALTAATGRPVRFVGRPDIAPVGALVRRLGGLLDRPDEVAGALRAGELVVMGAAADAAPAPCRARRPPPDRRGSRDRRPVFPAATTSSPWAAGTRSRSARRCVPAGAAAAR